MGSKELRGRDIWQDVSGANATVAETNFFTIFTQAFKGTDYRIRAKPKEFNSVYVSVQLGADVIAEIYTPEKAITRHGVIPDYAIDNTKTGKTLYVEVKRQDGWIEGGKRQDGRGNAHERSCKFFTPGLLKLLRSKGGLGDDVLPFWVVFQGAITRDPCRVREITFWYTGYEQHVFFWRNSSDKQPLLNHFNKYFKKLLD